MPVSPVVPLKHFEVGAESTVNQRWCLSVAIQRIEHSSTSWNGPNRTHPVMANQTSTIRSRGMELLMEYKQSPSVALRNQLVRLNAGLVRKIAHRISHQCSEPYEDLEQIGYMKI